MQRDLFKEFNISHDDSSAPVDLFAGLPPQPKYQDASFLEKLPANIAAGLGTLGHNILGESHREWDAIAPFISKHIPRQQDYDYSQMLGLPGTTADKVVQGFAENAPLFANPAGDLGLIGRGIAAIPKAGPFLASAASRIVPQSLLGAATSEDPFEGGKQAGLVQGAFEALPLPFKAAGKYAEAINPIKFVTNKLGEIRGELKKSEIAEKEAYKPFNEIASQHEIGIPKNYYESYKENKPLFDSRINRLDKKFNEVPTLENAHKLQSRMFKGIRQEYKKVDPDFEKIEALNESREALKKDITKQLEKIDRNVASKYKQGAEIHKEQISPHFSTPELAHLIQGNIKNLQPTRLHKALNTANEKNLIPENHYLNRALEDITTKLNKGKAVQYGVPAAVAPFVSMVGGHSGIGPVLASMAAGGLIGHGAGKVADLAQNPEIERLLRALGKGVKTYGAPIARGILD
jgi:hypothetical protein